MIPSPSARLVLAALAVTASLASGCKKHEDPMSIPLQGGQPPPQETSAPAPDVRDAPTITAALAEARAKMGDGPAPSEGALLFAAWADRSLDWADVDRPSETTTARVLERPSDARGKRLCESGEIAEIGDFDAQGTKVHAGRLVVGQATLHFLAVRSVGTLAPKAHARLCGVVTGIVEAPKEQGGPMVQVVGLFELPENRRALGGGGAATPGYTGHTGPAATTSAAAEPSGAPKRGPRTISSTL